MHVLIWWYAGSLRPELFCCKEEIWALQAALELHRGFHVKVQPCLRCCLQEHPGQHSAQQPFNNSTGVWLMAPDGICVPDPAVSAYCRVNPFCCHTSVQYEKEVLHNNLQKGTEITLRVHEFHPTKQQSRREAVPRADQISWEAGTSHLFSSDKFQLWCHQCHDAGRACGPVQWLPRGRGSEPSLGSPRSGAGFEIAQKSGREMVSPFLFTFSPSETAVSGSFIACQTKQFQ